MQTHARLAAVVTAAAIVVAVEDIVDPAIALALVVAAAAAAWRTVPGFWRSVLAGGVGGAVAGIVILGPGMRLAMRIVAVLDPLRTPEFTVEGTVFLVVAIGGVFGGVLGIVATLLRRGLDLSVRATTGAVTVLLMGLFLAEPDVRAEFVELGAGPWMNVPMFTVVVLGYGYAAVRLAARLERARERPPVGAAAELRA
jgi:hypothetical protein